MGRATFKCCGFQKATEAAMRVCVVCMWRVAENSSYRIGQAAEHNTTRWVYRERKAVMELAFLTCEKNYRKMTE